MKKLLLFLFLLTVFKTYSQEDAWIFLKDKPNKETFINNPLKMLSQRALDRRGIQQVALDSLDVPVDENYYNQIKNEENITVLAKSKWLNAIHIQGQVEDINNLLSTYSFIDYIEFANKALNTNGKSTTKSKIIISKHYNKFNEALSDFNYGDAENQIKMLKGDYLHGQGFTGGNQIIAIIDAGFPNVNTLEAFQRIRDNSQILGGYNFADRNENFYTRNSHGTHVLSSIAGYLENEFVGTAPDAKFYLFISEIAETETVLEETLWVEAAERADSLGVDVINTSLGYTTYDNPNHSHTYEDLDGKTTFITRGAEIGASRGMLLVNSAGNSGSRSWKYIGAPADAPSVISVGAVNASGEIAAFSSFGPTSDGRIKPEILGQGQNPALINYSSGAVTKSSSGTSFSSPIIAGLIACLNQEIPLFVKGNGKKDSSDPSVGGYYNNYLKRGLYESADKYDNPLEQHGYGIPNFELAQSIYYSLVPSSVDDNFLSKLFIYPNPIKDSFTISSETVTLNDFTIQVFNILGKKVLEKVNLNSRTVDISFLKNGVYMLKISKGNQHRTLKLIKK